MLVQRMVWKAAIVVCAVAADCAHAATPGIVGYQGRVLVSNAPFNGAGAFKFALVDTTGGTTYWSNDNTSTAGSEPTAAVSVTVTNGLYSVLLGDMTVTNMTNAIPVNVFSNNVVKLRVWFNDGTNGSKLLSPDQRIVPVGYALAADTATNVNGGTGNFTGATSGNSAGTIVVASTGNNTGHAGRFIVNNAANDGNAIYATTAGIGYAGYFESANNVGGVAAVNTGAGSAGLFLSYSGPSILSSSLSTGTGKHMSMVTAGTEVAQITKSGQLICNAISSVGGNTFTDDGVHSPGSFTVSNATNNSPALFATTNGSGPVLSVDGSAAAVSATLVAQFRTRSTSAITIDQNGNVNCNVCNQTSDRNQKFDVVEVDCKDVLDKLVKIPVQRWKFIAVPDVTHIGPMAQDFYAAYALGTDEKHISTTDAQGVALAAIQALAKRSECLQKENKELKARLDAIEALVKDFKK